MARITVVDDYPDFLEVMYSILDGLGGHTVAGFDGEEATLEQLVESDPELLIVDLRIAGDDMRGWDTLMLARADDRLRAVPLIVCSADVETLHARTDEFKRVGNIFTLEKPFSVADVIAAVNDALAGGLVELQAEPPAAEAV